MHTPSIHFSGDSAFIVRFGNSISPCIHQKLKAYEQTLKNLAKEGITNIIPAYTDLLVNYDPSIINYKEVYQLLQNITTTSNKHHTLQNRIIHIPVLYETNEESDINTVASHNKLSIPEVIELHSNASYLVYMLGFTPGFPYLGGLSNKLYTPRRKTPRQKIEAGSVGIAGEQTGIYPIDSPGGWQIIGKTPIPLFNIEQQATCVVNSGDYIKFEPINSQEFDKIYHQIKENTYTIYTEPIDEK